MNQWQWLPAVTLRRAVVIDYTLTGSLLSHREATRLYCTRCIPLGPLFELTRVTGTVLSPNLWISFPASTSGPWSLAT